MKKPLDRHFNRRNFLKASGAGITGLALLPHLNAQPVPDGAVTSLRRTFSFNHGWLYSDKHVPNAIQPEFDDRRFVRVTIPHTNRLLPWNGFDDKSFQFVSVYRRHVKLPAELQNRRVFIDFGGVMTAAAVTINGQRLGEYRGGYTPFSHELTPHLNWKGDNLLAVEVDSTERKDIPPFGGNIDYLTFGGIYRDVTLRALNETFIENVFAKPVNVLRDDRRLEVRCFINNRSAGRPMKLTVELRDG